MDDGLTSPAQKTRWPRFWLLVGLAALFLLAAGGGAFLVTALSPLWSQETLLSENSALATSPEYVEVTKRIRQDIRGKLRPLTVKQLGYRKLSPLVYEEFLVEGSVQRGSDGQLALGFRLLLSERRVRFDRLPPTLGALLFLVLLIAGLLVWWSGRGTTIRSEPRGNENAPETERLLAQEIERLEGALSHYDSRAVKLLWFTGAAALGGLGAFYYFVPTEALIDVQQEGASIPSTVVKLFLLATYVQSVALLLAKLHRQAVGDGERVMHLRLGLVRLLAAAQLAKAQGATVPASAEKLLNALLANGGAKGGDETGSPEGDRNLAETVGKVLSEIRKHLPGGS
jgi:hypothetical protein